MRIGSPLRSRLQGLAWALTLASAAPILSAQTLTIPSGQLPGATLGRSYTQTLTVSGGVSPYRWTPSSPLPPGMTLSLVGVVSGTPTQTGNFSFSVHVTDAANASGSATFGIAITSVLLQIATAPPLFNGQIGAPYSQTFSATGGLPPYTWSLAAGGVPGLTLDATSGALTGTPQTAGTFNFAIKVVDALNNSASTSFALTVTAPPLLLTAGASLPSGAVGVAYDQKLQVTATGGTPPYSWLLLNGPVPGLSLNPAAIELAGTPTAAGTYNLGIQVTDSAGVSASRPFTLVVTAAALSITTSRQLGSGALNSAYSQAMAASGGVPPYTWSANGLPTGLTINSSTGLIGGTPTAAGTFTAVITVTDNALNSFRDNFTLTVQLPTLPALTISSLPSSAGAAQQIPLQVSLAAPYSAPIKGQLLLSFQPNSGPNDSSIQFSTGGRSASFNIAQGSTSATFTDSSGLPAPQLQFQTGTAAGSIIVTLSNLIAAGLDVTPTPAPTVSTQVAAVAPVITSIQVIRNADAASGCQTGQICLEVTGYSTSRDLSQATFTFQAAAGQSLQSSAGSISVNVSSLFTSWFASSTLGSQFIFVQPFTATGDPNSVSPVSVTLVNRIGSTTGNVN